MWEEMIGVALEPLLGYVYQLPHPFTYLVAELLRKQKPDGL